MHKYSDVVWRGGAEEAYLSHGHDLHVLLVGGAVVLPQHHAVVAPETSQSIFSINVRKISTS